MDLCTVQSCRKTNLPVAFDVIVLWWLKDGEGFKVWLEVWGWKNNRKLLKCDSSAFTTLHLNIWCETAALTKPPPTKSSETCSFSSADSLHGRAFYLNSLPPDIPRTDPQKLISPDSWKSLTRLILNSTPSFDWPIGLVDLVSSLWRISTRILADQLLRPGTWTGLHCECSNRVFHLDVSTACFLKVGARAIQSGSVCDGETSPSLRLL